MLFFLLFLLIVQTRRRCSEIVLDPDLDTASGETSLYSLTNHIYGHLVDFYNVVYTSEDLNSLFFGDDFSSLCDINLRGRIPSSDINIAYTADTEIHRHLTEAEMETAFGGLALLGFESVSVSAQKSLFRAAAAILLNTDSSTFFPGNEACKRTTRLVVAYTESAPDDAKVDRALALFRATAVTHILVDELKVTPTATEKSALVEHWNTETDKTGLRVLLRVQIAEQLPVDLKALVAELKQLALQKGFDGVDLRIEKHLVLQNEKKFVCWVLHFVKALREKWATAVFSITAESALFRPLREVVSKEYFACINKSINTYLLSKTLDNICTTCYVWTEQDKQNVITARQFCNETYQPNTHESFFTKIGFVSL